jgi:ectoine hydroxylase-related dioxygenase (phytanoyl-CoA dioxygenase family)
VDWLDNFRDQGFIVLRNILPHDLIDIHTAQMTGLCARHGVIDRESLAKMLEAAEDDDLMTAMLQVHQRDKTAQALIREAVLDEHLTRLLGGDPVLVSARSQLWEMGNMRAHIDTAFRSPEPPYFVGRTWCALEDIHPESGRFYLVPQTHRTLVPKLCAEVLDKRPDLRALHELAATDPHARHQLLTRAWPLVVAKVADHVRPEDKYVPNLRKGDVIIFNPAIAHGTMACTDRSQTRKMMVCEWASPVDGHMGTVKPQKVEALAQLMA